MTGNRAGHRVAALLLVLWATGPLVARTWTVGPDGVHKKLAVALASAEPHDTIRVLQGTYSEGTLTIDRPLTLIGIGRPVIDGGRQGDVLVITAPDVTVQGFVVRGTLLSNIDDNAGIKVKKSDNVKILDNVLEHCFFAIHVSNSRNTVVAGNSVLGDPDEIETRQANGIHLWRCSGAEVVDNVSQDHRDGIYFEFVTDSHVRRNKSMRNSRYGLHFMFSHRDTYSDNLFTENGAGVAVMYSKEVEMRRNRFISNRGASSYGLLLKEINDVVIDSNQFINNTTGMLVDGCNRAEVNGNIFQANGWALRLFANATDGRFTGNSFIGNTFDMSTNGNPVYNSFSGNYWDRYQGYDLEHDGTGDVPFRPVSLFAMVNERMPYAVVLSRSLLTQLLDRAERLVPSMTPPGLEDDKPLMRSPHGTRNL
ncbi:MAG: nitrous oxide reductase family maturation protein NosD [Flavobacteriales bacterium]|jgi:nitrous oxidase accessory protein|nr:nitrous oxide reductase family maturation protein NosD [Flavobacteriales bacterium]MCB0758359.1 nitrous oxide reductase family maturation protein NosD [Flavobacteriales bacterium]